MSRLGSLTAVAMMYCTGTCTSHDSQYSDMADVKRYRPFVPIERQCHGMQLVFHISRSMSFRGVAEAFPSEAGREHVACTFKLVLFCIHAGLDSLDPQMRDNARGDTIKPSYEKQPVGFRARILLK